MHYFPFLNGPVLSISGEWLESCIVNSCKTTEVGRCSLTETWLYGVCLFVFCCWFFLGGGLFWFYLFFCCEEVIKSKLNMQWINESEESSFVLLTNLYIKSFFFSQEADVASVTALSEYSHIFVAEPKNIQFIEILRTASGEMTDTATTSYPKFPLCLTAKTKQCNMWYKPIQNQATDVVFTAALWIQEDGMARNTG